jgi:hypothetical protein
MNIRGISYRFFDVHRRTCPPTLQSKQPPSTAFNVENGLLAI